MSRPRLHQELQVLFEERSEEKLQNVLSHPDFSRFIDQHALNIPLRELVRAFTHSSFSHEYYRPDQEQLEFLGDSVLQLLLTEELCLRFPEAKEGHLSKLRSSLVNEKRLSEVALTLGLSELILVGKGEFKKNLQSQETVLADTLEALLGVVFLSHGLTGTRDFFLRCFGSAIPAEFEKRDMDEFDAKSRLQELSLAKYKKLPRYSAEQKGDLFEVSVWIDEELRAQGTFRSKKNGEKELAREVIMKGNI